MSAPTSLDMRDVAESILRSCDKIQNATGWDEGEAPPCAWMGAWIHEIEDRAKLLILQIETRDRAR